MILHSNRLFHNQSLFTTNAPVFRQLVHDAPSYGPSVAGMLSRLVDALVLDCAIQRMPAYICNVFKANAQPRATCQ